MKNLLIVDDESLLLANMRILLTPYSTEIYTASNGKEGLDVLQSKEVHCVICDITMPVMNGVEFIREARQMKIEVPFIFYSAYGSHDLMMEVSKYGAFDFLKKPDFQDLESIVQRGLAEGFKRKYPDSKEPGDYISEYQRLLEKIQQQNKE